MSLINSYLFYILNYYILLLYYILYFYYCEMEGCSSQGHRKFDFVDFVLRIIFPIYRYNFNQQRLIILTIGNRRIIFTFLPYVAIIILL